MKVLYREYRPDTFQDLIGQDAVVQALTRALDNSRLGHAYLFSGPRGCGKTTSARIFARCLNCEAGPTSTPCGKCPSCVELASSGSGSVDVIEMDAASNGGIDDARDLRERLGFAPSRDRFKIVILDEAHMITPNAFAALLKLVEEPPEHVKFIFATTDPQKVIPTIRSRTYQYAFRLVPPSIMQPLLEKIAELEKIKVEPEVYSIVIKAGGGSVRDTLSFLDQLFAGSVNNLVDQKFAAALLGITPIELINAFLNSLAEKQVKELFEVIQKSIIVGAEPHRFLLDLLDEIRLAIIVRTLDIQKLQNNKAEIRAAIGEKSEEQFQVYSKLANSFLADELIKVAEIISETVNNMTGIIAPSLQLEICVAKLAAAVTVNFSEAKPAQLTNSVPQTNSVSQSSPKLAPTQTNSNSSTKSEVSVPANAPETAVQTNQNSYELTDEIKENWNLLIQNLKENRKGGAAVLFGGQTKLLGINGENLFVTTTNPKFIETAKENGYIPLVSGMTANFFKKHLNLQMILSNEGLVNEEDDEEISDNDQVIQKTGDVLESAESVFGPISYEDGQ